MNHNELNKIYKTSFCKLINVDKKISMNKLNKLSEKKMKDIYKLNFEDLKNYLLK